MFHCNQKRRNRSAFRRSTISCCRRRSSSKSRRLPVQPEHNPHKRALLHLRQVSVSNSGGNSPHTRPRSSAGRKREGSEKRRTRSGRFENEQSCANEQGSAHARKLVLKAAGPWRPAHQSLSRTGRKRMSSCVNTMTRFGKNLSFATPSSRIGGRLAYCCDCPRRARLRPSKILDRSSLLKQLEARTHGGSRMLSKEGPSQLADAHAQSIVSG